MQKKRTDNTDTVIEKSALFSFLTPREQELFFPLLEEKKVSANEILFRRGERAEKIYFVAAGKIAVKKETGFEGSSLVVGLLGPGAPVGERGLLSDGKRGATVVGAVDSLVYVFSSAQFERLKNDEPAIAIKVLEWLLRRAALRLELNSDRLAHVL